MLLKRMQDNARLAHGNNVLKTTNFPLHTNQKISIYVLRKLPYLPYKDPLPGEKLPFH